MVKYVYQKYIPLYEHYTDRNKNKPGTRGQLRKLQILVDGLTGLTGLTGLMELTRLTGTVGTDGIDGKNATDPMQRLPQELLALFLIQAFS